MSFPAVAASSESAEGAGTTAHDLVIPSGLTAGDRLVAVIVVIGAATTVSGFPTGWNQVGSRASAGTSRFIEVWEKLVAAGDETDFQYTTGASRTSYNRMLRVTGAHATSAAELAGDGDISDDEVDPPEVTASWGSADNLFLVATANTESEATAYTGYTAVDTTPDGTLDLFRKDAAAASDNPALYTLASPGEWAAVTVVIRPAGAAGGGLAAHIPHYGVAL